VQLTHRVTVEQDRCIPASIRFLRKRGEMGGHFPPGEIEELLRTMRDVLTEMR